VQIRLDEHGNVVEYRARRGLLGWSTPRAKIDPKRLGTAGGEMGVVREIADGNSAPPELLAFYPERAHPVDAAVSSRLSVH
jgi:hypothetical protein